MIDTVTFDMRRAKKNIIILILGLACCFNLLTLSTVTVEIKTLFYEYQKSAQWFFKVTTETVTKVRNERITYKLTTNAQKGFKLAQLKQYDMVLFGTHGIGGWASYHLEDVEKDLTTYVEGGGVVLVHTSNDKHFKGDMFPVELLMLENGDEDFEVTPEGQKSGIFDKPNKVNNVVEDDTYQDVKSLGLFYLKAKAKEHHIYYN